MGDRRGGTGKRSGTAPARPLERESSGRIKGGAHRDPAVVGRRIADEFGLEYHETEGPCAVGRYRLWACWVHTGDYYEVHYGVSEPGGDLLYFRNFPPFAIWLQEVFAKDAEAAAAALHERRLEWVRVAVAAAIVLVLLALVFLQIGVRDREGFNVSHVIAVIGGAGITFLLGGGSKAVRRWLFGKGAPRLDGGPPADP